MDNFTIKSDKKSIVAKIKARCQKAQEVISSEFLKDANKYARHDSGEMIESSQRSSDLKKGIIRWDTPYARKVYYLGTPSKDRNPNASLQWARKAHLENRKKYKEIIEKIE